VLVVDTSVWILAFKGREPYKSNLRFIIEDQTVIISRVTYIELLLGIRKVDLPRFKKLLEPLHIKSPTNETWGIVEKSMPKIRLAGEHFSIPDMLIAADAKILDCPVWSVDSDFKRMREIGLVELFDS
jgi:predicted nucleic acid-binding protein